MNRYWAEFLQMTGPWAKMWNGANTATRLQVQTHTVDGEIHRVGEMEQKFGLLCRCSWSHLCKAEASSYTWAVWIWKTRMKLWLPKALTSSEEMWPTSTRRRWRCWQSTSTRHELPGTPWRGMTRTVSYHETTWSLTPKGTLPKPAQCILKKREHEPERETENEPEPDIYENENTNKPESENKPEPDISDSENDMGDDKLLTQRLGSIFNDIGLREITPMQHGLSKESDCKAVDDDDDDIDLEIDDHTPTDRHSTTRRRSRAYTQRTPMVKPTHATPWASAVWCGELLSLGCAAKSWKKQIM